MVLPELSLHSNYDKRELLDWCACEIKKPILSG
jgi:hypothetical protein